MRGRYLETVRYLLLTETGEREGQEGKLTLALSIGIICQLEFVYLRDVCELTGE